MNSELRRDLTAKDGPLAGAVITDISPVGGGCIHQAWKLRLSDGQELFAKSGGASALPLFEVEAEALEALHGQADASFLVVPQPIALAALPHGAVLLLPWLDFGGSDQAALGRGLALLHQSSMASSPARFGWHRDGFIGAGPQPGGGVMTGDRPSWSSGCARNSRSLMGCSWIQRTSIRCCCASPST